MPNLSSILTIIQIITGLLLIIFILLQQRGSGLSSVFGGEHMFYHTKRGLEKFIFISTIVLAVLFIIVSLGRVII